MLSLLVRNLFFTILQPGMVVGIIPYLLLRYEGKMVLPDLRTIWQYLGLVLAIPGVLILLSCVVRFMTEGKGTISPLDPTRKLVARGLYKYSRNPMYLGAMLVLAGETIFFQSSITAVYAALVFLVFNLVIILHEEPRLRRDFGDEYKAYSQNVRRWL